MLLSLSFVLLSGCPQWAAKLDIPPPLRSTRSRSFQNEDGVFQQKLLSGTQRWKNLVQRKQ